MLDKISKGFDVLVKILVIIACVAAVYNFFFKDDAAPEIVQAPGGKATAEFVQQEIKDKDDAGHVYKEIVTIREGAEKPLYSFPSNTPQETIDAFPSNTPQETIDAAVKSDGGDKVIAENRPEAEGGGTNIYSIHTDSSKHGIGIYAGASTDSGLGSVAMGIHVRNKRWIYQLGMTKDGGVDARVAYELIQW